VLRELKQSVRHDLQNLLNTRICSIPPPPELLELRQSLVSYGIPDLTGASFDDPRAREQFTKTIEDVIRRYEPRLQKLSVRLLNRTDPADRGIHFQIDATLPVEPAPEPIQFDSILRLPTGSVEVKGERNE
jgi:type VI secretion system protein ImpF